MYIQHSKNEHYEKQIDSFPPVRTQRWTGYTRNAHAESIRGDSGLSRLYIQATAGPRALAHSYIPELICGDSGLSRLYIQLGDCGNACFGIAMRYTAFLSVAPHS